MTSLKFTRRLVPLCALLAMTLLPAACKPPAEDAGPSGPSGPAESQAGGGIAPQGQAPAAAASEALAAPSTGGTTLLTRLAADATGIHHQNYLPPEKSGQYLYVGAGVAAGDYDADGNVDLFLVSQAGESKLFRNRGDWHFEDATAAAGVAIKRDEATGERFKERYPMGATFLDYDGDGDLDLFVTVFAGSNILFQNDGKGKFSDVTQAAGLTYVGASTSTAIADYDRDGDLDLYVATYRPYGNTKFYPPGTAPGPEPELGYDGKPLPDGTFAAEPEADFLYQNNGDGTFTDRAEAAGIGKTRDWGLGAVFGDVTGDGWPDLYVANDFQTPDRFFVNQRDGTFHPMPAVAMRHTPFFSMGVDMGDVNNDGRLDLMTSDMMSPSRMRRQVESMEGLLSTDMAMDMGMGAMDEATQVMRNSLFLNNGDGSFSDVAPIAGVTATDWTWSVKLADMDLDGLPDLLATNGFVHDAMNIDEIIRINMLKAQGNTQGAIEAQRARPRLLTPKAAYRNVDGLRFQLVSEEWGFDDGEIAHGMALADLDNDGDLDAVLNTMNAPVGVYRNDAKSARVKVVLHGQGGNRLGIGARVTLTGTQGAQTREVSSSGGYLSGHEAVAVFGLGEAPGTGPLALQVDWPSGKRSEVKDVKPGQKVVVTEPDGKSTLTAPPAAAPTQFEEASEALGVKFTHLESHYDDFKVQPLLPIRLSQFGPGVAWGDADGDGWDDLFIAGPRGLPGAFFRSQKGQSFASAPTPSGAAGGLEAQGALWLPGDKNADLFISQSSLETVVAADGAPSEQPIGIRYAWRGEGFTETARSSAGVSSGGALAAADFDADGHLDVFAGGRLVPGRYPLDAASVLLRGGPDGLAATTAPAEARVLGDAAAGVLGEAAALTGTLGSGGGTGAAGGVTGTVGAGAGSAADAGMVTGAVWTDVDGDTDVDLVLARDWGSLRLLRNDSGHLADATEAAGLAGYKGWWNGIASGDVDHDGDMDLVATNVGLNTRYQATDEAPLVLYAGDLDGDNTLDLIEGEWDGGKLYAMRQVPDVIRDTPSVLERFASAQAFAGATLEQVYGADRLAKARRLEANWLATTLFLNDGKGRFTAKALPDAAQLTAGYGVVVADLDNDGNDDIYLVGNFYGPEPMHTGPFDGGVSVWLKGDGKGGFASVPVAQSGLTVPYDAKGLAATDFDHDGWVDLAVGVNNGPARLFHNKGVAGRKGLDVRLVGPAGNPQGIGARITVVRSDGVTMTREVQAGSSFLSQNGSTHVFGLGETTGPASVTVSWPRMGAEATETVVEEAMPGEVVVVEKP